MALLHATRQVCRAFWLRAREERSVADGEISTACRSGDFEAQASLLRSVRRLHPRASTSPRKLENLRTASPPPWIRASAERATAMALRLLPNVTIRSKRRRAWVANHEQRVEERTPVEGSVLGRRGTPLAVGTAVAVEQLSRETGRLLRGDASVSRGWRDRRPPTADRGRPNMTDLSSTRNSVRTRMCRRVGATHRSFGSGWDTRNRPSLRVSCPCCHQSHSPSSVRH